MRNIRLLIEYDGTRYDGWQRQGKSADQRTIQGKIEGVLRRMTGEQIEIYGSGRTDAGVHALGQVANFHTGSELSCEEIRAGLNHYLPDDIGVLAAAEAGPRFHSRLNARSKMYRYRIVEGDTPCVFDRKYVYRYEGSLSVPAMQEAAAFLIGRHDFAAFTPARREKKSTVRQITALRIRRAGREGHEIILEIEGDGFLRHMVRIIVGTLMEVGAGRRRPEDMKRILESRNRVEAGVTALPQGLVLVKVEY